MPEEYAGLNREVRRLGDAVRAKLVNVKTVTEFMRGVTAQHFRGTMQAQAIEQPFGYAGDFQIIDHIYTLKTAKEAHLKRWDLFFHSQAAPRAVRNRKAYFLSQLERWTQEQSGQPLHVLNVASGPARDVREWFLENPDSDVVLDCVDMDGNAISHAKQLCAAFTEQVTFHHRNVLRFVPQRAYDLVWSAGLFDYLSDKVFVHLLKSLIAVTRKGGEVIVGNFSEYNSSRDYMELLGDWHLKHRSHADLVRLAAAAGAVNGSVEVQWEAEGVNLFLHIRC